jgi:tyrosine-specific transport protein
VLQKGNAILMLLMWLAFGGLLFMAAGEVEPSRLTYADPMLLPSALPIMVTAFHFHNIIPTTCRSLDWDRKSVIKALFIGTLIGLCMNLLWNVVVTGSLPVSGYEESILYAFDHGLPATVPLSKVLNSSVFTTVGMVFAILAITTSYMANGTALMGFVRDMFSLPAHGAGRILTALITFVPPLLVAVFYPGLFLEALDMVGGVGIALLFGVLPGLLLFKDSQTTLGRSLSIFIVAFFLLVLLFELGQEFGLLTIDADTEVWKTSHNL